MSSLKTQKFDIHARFVRMNIKFPIFLPVDVRHTWQTSGLRLPASC